MDTFLVPPCLSYALIASFLTLVPDTGAYPVQNKQLTGESGDALPVHTGASPLA